MIQKIINTINGYDFFISYTWSDGRAYAQELFKQLTAIGFVCFLDDVSFKKGDDWTLVGAIALRHTGKLLLVVTPEVINSDPVLRELQVFKKTNREIIPIDIGLAFDKFPTDSKIMEIIDSKILRINENKHQQQKGPSNTTIQEIQQNFDLTKQNTKRVRNLTITIVVLLAFLGLAILLYLQSEKHRTEAIRETARVLETQGQSAQENGLQMSAMSYYGAAIAKRAATGEKDSAGRLRLGVLADRTPILRNVFQNGDSVVKVEFGPYGRHAIVYSRFYSGGGYAKGGYTDASLWNVTTGELIIGFDKKQRNFRFSPNAALLVSYSENRAVLWDVISGNRLRYLDGHTAPVTKAVFSPDGKEVVTSSRDGTIRTWDPLTGAELARLDSKSEGIYEFQFNPNGTFIATAALDGVELWNYASRTLEQSWPLERGASDVHFNKDGSRLASIPSNYFVSRNPDANDFNGYVWDMQSREMIKMSKPVTSVRLLGENRIFMQLRGAMILGRGGPPSEGEVVVIRPPSSRQPLATVQTHIPPAPDIQEDNDPSGDALSISVKDTPVNTLRNVDGRLIAVSPSEKSFIVVHGSTANLITSKTGRIRCVLGNGISVAKYSPDGQRVLTNALDNTARLWDTASCQQDIALEGHTAPVSDVAFSSDGTVATASKDGTVRIWDLSKHSSLHVDQHHGSITFSEISPDGSKVVTASSGRGWTIFDHWSDGKTFVWDTRTGRPISEIDDIGKGLLENTSLQDVITDFRNGRIFMSYQDVITNPIHNLVKVVNTSDGTLVAQIDRGTLRGVSPPTGTFITADDQVHIWDSQTGELRFSLEGQLPIGDPQHFPEVIATLVDDKDKQYYALQSWSLTDGKPGIRIKRIREKSFDDNGREDPISRVNLIFSENKHHVALLSESGQSLLCDLNTGEVTGKFNVPPFVRKDGRGVHGSSTDLALFSPDNKYLITVGNTTDIWDAVTGKQYSALRGRFLDFHPESTRVATLNDGQVLTWNLATSELEHILRWGDEQVTTGRYSQDGEQLIVGTRSGRIYIWDADSGVLLAQLGKFNSEIASLAVSRMGRQILAGSVTGKVAVWSANEFELADEHIVEWVSARTGLTQQSGRVVGSREDEWRNGRKALQERLEQVLMKKKNISHSLAVANALADLSPGNRTVIRTLLGTLNSKDKNEINTAWNILRKTDHESPEFTQQVLNGVGSETFNRDQVLLVSLLGRAAIPTLSRLINEDDKLDVDTRAEFVFGLRRFGVDAITILGQATTSKDWKIRLTAAKALEALGEDAQNAATQLVQAIGMDHREAGIAAGRALQRIGSTAVPALVEGLKSADNVIRLNSIIILAVMERDAREAVVQLVRVALHDADKRIRRKAAQALITIDSAGDSRGISILSMFREHKDRYSGDLSIDLLTEAMINGNQGIRRRCLEVLEILRDGQGYGEGPTDKPFVIALKDSSYEIRELATLILVVNGAEEVLAKAGKIVIPHMVKLLDHRDSKIRNRAMMELWAVAENEKLKKDIAPWTKAILEARRDDATAIYAKHTLGRLEKWSLPFLVRSLHDASPATQAEASVWIGNLKEDGKEAYSDLEVLLEDPEQTVRLAAASAMLDVGDSSEKIEFTLISLLQQSENAEQRSRTAAVMRKLPIAAPQIIDALENSMNDSSPRVRYEAANSLLTFEIKLEHAIDTLQALLLPQAGDAEVSVDAASRLAKLGDSAHRTIPMIRKAASAFPVEFDVNKRMKFVWALIQLDALDELLNVVATETYVSSWYSSVFNHIKKLLPKRLDALPQVIKLLDNDNDGIREFGCKILGALGEKAESAIPALTKATSDHEDNVRSAAILAIESISN